MLGGSVVGDRIGAVLGGTYRLDRLIGEGGMGSVYEAAHMRLPRKFAIKLLNPEVIGNREVLERFQREAEIASSIGNDNIVQVFDFNYEEGIPYMVLELLKGEDLGARRKRGGRLSVAETARILEQVASGLEAAHAAGVIHRDLKPSNIFLCQKGNRADFVKILDFGISKVLDAQNSGQTRTGLVMGTPNYMSPEQAEGRQPDVDYRTDIFSLGAILYECITGRKAFHGPTPIGTIYQVVHTYPDPIAAFAPETPPGIEPVLGRAMAKRREERYPSAQALYADFLTAAGPAALAPSGIGMAYAPMAPGPSGPGPVTRPTMTPEPAAPSSPGGGMYTPPPAMTGIQAGPRTPPPGAQGAPGGPRTPPPGAQAGMPPQGGPPPQAGGQPATAMLRTPTPFSTANPPTPHSGIGSTAAAGFTPPPGTLPPYQTGYPVPVNYGQGAPGAEPQAPLADAPGSNKRRVLVAMLVTLLVAGGAVAALVVAGGKGGGGANAAATGGGAGGGASAGPSAAGASAPAADAAGALVVQAGPGAPAAAPPDAAPAAGPTIEPIPTAATPDAAPSEEPKLVTIELTLVPRDATVELDGAVVTERPLRLPPGDAPRVLLVSAAGYEPETRELRPSADGKVEVRLKKARKTPRPRDPKDPKVPIQGPIESGWK